MNTSNQTNTYRKKRSRHDVSIWLRVGARTGAVGLLFANLLYGIIAGGHVTDPNSALYNIKGKVAAKFGYAAQDISIAGLRKHKPASVLSVINVRPNDSLIGFDPRQARSRLENVDWIKSAKVRRLNPNRLEIDIVERHPFAIWQRDGEFYVIDKNGLAFTSIDARDAKGLLVVTGEGAHKKVFDLVNHMEAHKGLKSKVVAAGRIGERRWNLYLRSGTTVKLPETGLQEGLSRFVAFEKKFKLSDMAVKSVDFRFGDRVIVTPVRAEKEKVKVSQKQ